MTVSNGKRSKMPEFRWHHTIIKVWKALFSLYFLEKTHKRKTKESLTCLQVKYILKQIYLKRGYASRGEEVSCKQHRSSAKESQATLYGLYIFGEKEEIF